MLPPLASTPLSSNIAGCRRRKFFQGLAGVTAGLFLGRAQPGAAADPCAPKDIKLVDSAIGLAVGDLHVWIDGLEKGGRVTLAFLVKIKQSTARYVSKLVFGTEEKKTLGVRYFGPGDKISSDFVPYLILHDVDLSLSALYFLTIQVQEGGQTKIYRYPLLRSRLLRSSLGGGHLPQELEEDFAASHKGVVYSALHYLRRLSQETECASYPQKPLRCADAHRLRPRLISVNPLTNDFRVSIAFTHPDLSAQHFWRYFIVTDPVGRLLGLYKRSFKEASTASSVSVKALTAQDAFDRWGLGREHLASIVDCPYIKVFAEDVQDGLFAWDIWLR